MDPHHNNNDGDKHDDDDFNDEHEEGATRVDVSPVVPQQEPRKLLYDKNNNNTTTTTSTTTTPRDHCSGGRCLLRLFWPVVAITGCFGVGLLWWGLIRQHDRDRHLNRTRSKAREVDLDLKSIMDDAVRVASWAGQSCVPEAVASSNSSWARAQMRQLFEQATAETGDGIFQMVGCAPNVSRADRAIYEAQTIEYLLQKKAPRNATENYTGFWEPALEESNVTGKVRRPVSEFYFPLHLMEQQPNVGDNDDDLDLDLWSPRHTDVDWQVFVIRTLQLQEPVLWRSPPRQNIKGRFGILHRGGPPNKQPTKIGTGLERVGVVEINVQSLLRHLVEQTYYSISYVFLFDSVENIYDSLLKGAPGLASQNATLVGAVVAQQFCNVELPNDAFFHQCDYIGCYALDQQLPASFDHLVSKSWFYISTLYVADRKLTLVILTTREDIPVVFIFSMASAFMFIAVVLATWKCTRNRSSKNTPPQSVAVAEQETLASLEP